MVVGLGGWGCSQALSNAVGHTSERYDSLQRRVNGSITLKFALHIFRKDLKEITPGNRLVFSV